MLHPFCLTGRHLPPKTLCLTFDDGPGHTPPGVDTGPRTREIGAYLHRSGIRATFFVVGRHAAAHPRILAQLKAWGHLIGNHTYDHPSLPGFVTRGGDLEGQMARTVDVIAPHAGPGPYFFRAPYGDWHPALAMRLNAGPEGARHIGPVHWDVAPGDWWHWREGRSVAECAEAYVAAVRRAGRGIVLLHDATADGEAVSRRNRTLDLVRELVPRLRAEGYSFVRLDEVLVTSTP